MNVSTPSTAKSCAHLLPFPFAPFENSHNRFQTHYPSISNPQTLHPAPVAFRQNPPKSVLADRLPPSKPSPISNDKLSSRFFPMESSNLPPAGKFGGYTRFLPLWGVAWGSAPLPYLLCLQHGAMDVLFGCKATRQVGGEEDWRAARVSSQAGRRSDWEGSCLCTM
jgi:hypothetical protein